MDYTHSAQIQVNMITGDYGITAQAIATDVGMISTKQTPTIITGQELIDKRDVDLLHALQT